MEISLQRPQKLTLGDQLQALQAHALRLRTDSIAHRKQKLARLATWIEHHRSDIQRAAYQDFQKPPLEVDISEIYPVLVEIRHAIAQVDWWAKPKKVDATLTYLGTWSEIRVEPKGVCLIISPWNFPFNLCVGPLVSCLAAGNTAVVKPSELTPHTSSLIKRMVSDLFDHQEVVAVEGGVNETTELLELPFDHIFFTGSPSVGKIVMTAAAKHLTSVTLELGGKSPAIVDFTADLDDTARRITFGKFLNNGQTCIAPDYLLVHESVADALIEKLKAQIIQQFGDGQEITTASASYGRVINRRHFERITHLIQDAIRLGAKPVFTGPVNEPVRFVHPTILTNVSTEAQVMQEEIFGPVLPVMTYSRPNEPIEFVNGRPKPLALYVFGSKRFREKVVSETSAGTVCMNDCITQFTHPNLPFGGVNFSGIGKAHGYSGFLAFSNEKPVLRARGGFNLSYLFHPPYTPRMKKLIDLLLRWF